jgi:hypothetical protein
MRQVFITEYSQRLIRVLCVWIGVGAVLLLVGSCGRTESPRTAYVSIAQLEHSYGRLITVSNAPTPDQHGTGDRLGLTPDGR